MSNNVRPRLLQIINEFLFKGDEAYYYTDTKAQARPMLDCIEDLLAEEGYVRLTNREPGVPLRPGSGYTVEEVYGSSAQRARAESGTQKVQERGFSRGSSH
jgi:hypothetical protein